VPAVFPTANVAAICCVGDDAEFDPAFCFGITFVPAAVEAVSTVDHADAPLASVCHFWPLRNQRFSVRACARDFRWNGWECRRV
jgi:hypothetical protein